MRAKLCSVLCVLLCASPISPANLTGFGAADGFNPNAKTSKLLRVDDRLKRMVLARFFAAERVPIEEIEKRLRRWFGDQALDVDEEESTQELERLRSLHPHVAERIVIQYLTRERTRPIAIHRRLRRVSPLGQHLCNVYRWARRFREGRRRVESACAVRARCDRRTTGAPGAGGGAAAAGRRR